MRLIPIHPQNIDLALKDIGKHIHAALEYANDKYTFEDVVSLVKAESLILWVVYNDDRQEAVGCLLTETIKYPQKQCLFIFLLGGDCFDEIWQCFDELKEYAKGIGCDSLEFYGRPGWEKLLQAFQFKKIHTVMSLELI